MFSEHVKTAIATVLSQFRMAEPSRERTVNNLIFSYHLMRASEDLLRLARGRASGALRDYYAAHLQEERGHQRWLERDLATVGVKAKATPVPLRAVELVGSQFYLVKYVDPAALLGYMALLECFPQPLEEVEELERKFGTDLFRTLRYHAEHDIDHGGDVLKVIDTLPSKSQQIVFENAVQSARYFGLAATTF